MKALSLAALLWTVLTPMAQGAPANASCDPAALERDVRYLASDELEGRGLGSVGLEDAIEMVAQRFRELGLEPAFPDRATAAAPLAGYLQPFRSPDHPVSANVIGILPGSAERSPRALVLGAHVDHLGRDPGLEGDQIYNGADDNASGVAALLEVARMLTAEVAGEPSDDGVHAAGPKRTVVFAVFSAEESGLLGSKHYVEHPAVPLDEVIAMINLDSIGRMRDHQVIAFGAGTAREFPATLAGLNYAFGFDLVARSEGAGASDQASFFAKQIPVLHFFTGPHHDYSRVTDEAAKINFSGLAEVTDYVAELIRYLRYRPRPLTFVDAGGKQLAQMEAMAQQGQRKVSLGFMPDFSHEKGGVKVGPVSPEGAADAAGLQQGDTIIAIDGDVIDTLVDYTAILRSHAPGEHIRLVVHRGSETLELDAVLQERR
ncbi:MAG: M28 family peptidase [Candidatus Eisenbacteria sp.]|nr:M28 family peptidase [Candidatus Eisenbacteria bacterium]